MLYSEPKPQAIETEQELPLLGLLDRAGHSCGPPCSKMKPKRNVPSRQPSLGDNTLPAPRSECCCCVQSIIDAQQVAGSEAGIDTCLLLLGLVWEQDSPSLRARGRMTVVAHGHVSGEKNKRQSHFAQKCYHWWL